MKTTVNSADWMRSLSELGCDEDLTTQVMEALESRRTDFASDLLRRQKRILLRDLHDSERKVDLADFLLYQLKKI